MQDDLKDVTAAQQVIEQQMIEQQVIGQQVVEQQMIEQQMIEQQMIGQQVIGQQVIEQQMIEQQMVEQQMIEQQMVEQQMIEQQVYKAVQLTLKFGRWSSSVMLSQARSESQAGPGLGGCWERSSTCPPFKKNCHSSLFTWEADCRIRTHIWSDSSSLCRSNNPLHQNKKALVGSCYRYHSTRAAGSELFVRSHDIILLTASLLIQKTHSQQCGTDLQARGRGGRREKVKVGESALTWRCTCRQRRCGSHSSF